MDDDEKPETIDQDVLPLLREGAQSALVAARAFPGLLMTAGAVALCVAHLARSVRPPGASDAWVAAAVVVEFFFVWAPFSVVLKAATAESPQRETDLSLRGVLAAAFRSLVVVLATLIASWVGALLFVIPGLYLLLRLSLASHYNLSQGKGFARSFSDSCEATRGRLIPLSRLLLMISLSVGVPLMLPVIALVVVTRSSFPGWVSQSLAMTVGVFVSLMGLLVVQGSLSAFARRC